MLALREGNSFPPFHTFHSSSVEGVGHSQKIFEAFFQKSLYILFSSRAKDVLKVLIHDTIQYEAFSKKPFLVNLIDRVHDVSNVCRC